MSDEIPGATRLEALKLGPGPVIFLDIEFLERNAPFLHRILRHPAVSTGACRVDVDSG